MLAYERLERLFGLLCGNAPQPASRLATTLGVSTRTIRTDVSRLNDELAGHGAQVLTKWHEGYYIDVTDAAAFEEFSGELRHPDDASPLETAEGRMREAMRTLLFSDDYLSIEELASHVAVGENTIQGYLAQIRSTLEKYELECVTKRGVGLRVFGNEHDRRSCLLNEVLLADGPTNSRITKTEQAMLAPLDASAVHKMMSLEFQAAGIGISDLGLKRCVLGACVAALRIRQGHLVDPGITSQLSAELLELGESVSQRLEDELGEHFSASERTRMALMLATESDAEVTPIDTVALGAGIDAMLSLVAQDYGIDLRHDPTLRQNLMSHLALILKDKSRSSTRVNPMISTIRQSFPLAYEAAMTCAGDALRSCGLSLSEDEMGYIALHIGAAMERRHSTMRRRRRVALVCDSRPSAAEMLSVRMGMLFGQDIEIAWTGPLNKWLSLDADTMGSLDCAVSTTALPHCPVPSVTVGFDLPQADVKAVSRLLEGLNGRGGAEFSSLFDMSFFAVEDEPREKDELLAQMCAELHDAGMAEEDLLPLVLEREALADTSLNADLAIPHPIRPCCSHTGISVRVMRRPLAWSADHEAVRIVFLLFIKPGDVDRIEPLFNLLVKIADNASLRRAIIRAESFEEFREAISSAL